jgi:hypothetical protein
VTKNILEHPADFFLLGFNRRGKFCNSVLMKIVKENIAIKSCKPKLNW